MCSKPGLKEGASPHASLHAGGNDSDGGSSDDGMNDYYAGGEKRCACMRRLSARECMGSDFQRPTLRSQWTADQGRSCQKEGAFVNRKFGSRAWSAAAVRHSNFVGDTMHAGCQGPGGVGVRSRAPVRRCCWDRRRLGHFRAFQGNWPHTGRWHCRGERMLFAWG